MSGGLGEREGRGCEGEGRGNGVICEEICSRGRYIV